MDLIFDKLKDFLETDEGKASMKRFGEKLEASLRYDNRWAEKFHEFFEELSDDTINELAPKFLKWEEDYEDMFYFRGIQTHSNILSSLLDLARKYGKHLDCDEDFCGFKGEYRGYVVALYNGQGSIIEITKK